MSLDSPRAARGGCDAMGSPRPHHSRFAVRIAARSPRVRADPRRIAAPPAAVAPANSRPARAPRRRGERRCAPKAGKIAKKGS